MYLLPSNIWSIVMPRTRTDFTDGIGIASDKPACRRVAPLAGTVLILMLVIASVPDGMRGALGADSLADSDSSRRVELELDERAAAFRAGLLNGGDGQGMTSSRRQLLQNGNFTLPGLWPIRSTPAIPVCPNLILTRQGNHYDNPTRRCSLSICAS